MNDRETIRLGSDGELVSGKFCAYCGNQNAAESDYCLHCSAYIADQGPDLSARLARISRRGNTARVEHTKGTEQLIAASSDYAEDTRPTLNHWNRSAGLPSNTEPLPLSERLARVQRHSASYPTDDDRPSQWSILSLLFVGWLICAAIILAAFLIMSRVGPIWFTGW